MKGVWVILYFTSLVLLSGCYGGIQVHSDIGWGANYNADSSQVVFYKFHKVFRHPKGLLRFPDGGISKTLYENISLYMYIFSSDSLIHIYDFGSLNANRSVWETTAFFVNNDVVFNLSPFRLSSDKSIQVQQSDSASTSVSQKWFIYHASENRVTEIEPVEIDSTAIIKASLSFIRRQTEHIPLLEWGLNFNEILPQTKRQRLAEIENLENSRAYTLAIIELIGNDLSSQEISRMIRRINRYVDSKDNYDRMKILATRDTIVAKLKSLPQFK